MKLYRITSSLYKEDISGTGAALYGGRWNSKGNAVLYCSEHISLAILEIMVNVRINKNPILNEYHLLEIEIDEDEMIRITNDKLKKLWQLDKEYSQYIGDNFLIDNNKMAMAVPSAVIPEEHNFLINPNHKNFKQVKVLKSIPYSLDERLL